MIAVVEGGDGRPRIGLGRHLDIAEPVAAAGLSSPDDLNAVYGAERREERLKFPVRDIRDQVPNIK
jgi:hypothetical protein